MHYKDLSLCHSNVVDQCLCFYVLQKVCFSFILNRANIQESSRTVAVIRNQFVDIRWSYWKVIFWSSLFPKHQ